MKELKSLTKLPDYVIDALIEHYDINRFLWPPIRICNEYIELTFHENDFGVVFIKCTNIEIAESMLFIVPIPGKKEDFISLMKILNVI